MKPIQIESKLYDMVGRSYMYRNVNVRVLRFDVGAESTTIVTDVRDISFSNDNAKLKLGEMLPVSEEDTAREGVVLHKGEERASVRVPALTINTQSKVLSDIILRNIEMIEDDPEKNIKKASAINDQVKSFLEICKTEVEAMKVMAYVHKVQG